MSTAISGQIRQSRRPAPSQIAGYTVEEGLRAIEDGALTFEQWTRACLERIDERNPVVKAWVYINREAALQSARSADRGPRKSSLAGVPIGIKDIIDTADMPTELGDPEIFPGRQPKTDAALVTQIREIGFAILGKTTVSLHSIMLPGPARNPHDPSRTPGASSAGSAAAVADFMVPISIGTQTGGSILRPSTFCGAVGYKPTIDTLPYSGLRRYSRPLDTVGIITRSVADTMLAMREFSGDPRFDINTDVQKDVRVGVWRPKAWAGAEKVVHDTFDDNIRSLEAGGAKVSTLKIPSSFDKMAEDHDVIMAFDLSRSFSEIRRDHEDKCDPALLEYLDLGDSYTEADYAQVLSAADACRRQFYDVARDVDVIVTPATLGEAPDHSDTGSNAFIRLWTLLHNPTITLPVARSDRGLPIGLQVIGFVNEDPAFLHAARSIESIVGTKASKP
jgi:Asp-tRNA(Asn)/Glu-tRNA(Gln) amidotransferase A subunit family amidase